MEKKTELKKWLEVVLKKELDVDMYAKGLEHEWSEGTTDRNACIEIPAYQARSGHVENYQRSYDDVFGATVSNTFPREMGESPADYKAAVGRHVEEYRSAQIVKAQGIRAMKEMAELHELIRQVSDEKLKKIMWSKETYIHGVLKSALVKIGENGLHLD